MKKMKWGMAWFALSFVLAGPIWVMAQEAAAPEAPAAEPTHKKTTLIDLIKHGGWAMWPLGACSVTSITLAIMGFQRIRANAMMPPDVVAQIRSAAELQDAVKISEIAAAHDTFFTRPLQEGIRHYNPDDLEGSKVKMGEAIGEVIAREDTKFAFSINFLSLLTSMSPMWGLIGTVSGMIGAFSKIGTGGMGKPEQLAANIGEALVCTATGLIIAVFSMGCYFFFRNKLNALVKDAEKHYTYILDGLAGMHEEPAS